MTRRRGFPKERADRTAVLRQFRCAGQGRQPVGAFGHAAHVSLKEGKAFCFMSGPDEDSIRKAHAAINFPYDSITEVRRVTGADMRIPQPAKAQKRRAE